ncbi:MAG: aminotransferase class I/II-fold pyridoxal phosphate-dependent enzyme [Rhodospirillales bacterium]|nr:aminotransferase class I/II-fold pyridoxal phosphate-dependent enzyme [Rhodospirillales bacterium]MDH3909693.1 aminotransferase class I/II-fold pyridoxal phosphate-dependent enzyme [Rhodospirillales bacterium]MDH3918740.1 aminotransferase class I/II-fold pyridoxal phosphate-dependent enzyme [Rhodospirillales bacterium]MDH3965774.1 aminotransferase class I/II-fold pyridoxal phosphate-dependent enzyme [Rhodospirillales bacterium]
MTALPDFKLETHFSRWEFKVRYHLTASDAESLSLRDLLAMATPEEREDFEGLWLGYTETFGAPDLREVIAETFERRSVADILCFAGASEGIFAANAVLLDKDSHAIVVTPNYQSHETLPLATCAATGVPLDPDDNWSLDIDRVAEAIRPNTRLVTINVPHNPTGAILARDRFEALIDLCRRHGIYILSDEIFKGLGRTGTKHLPHVADLYERGLSLNVMSKAYGLPGLRIGWIACADRDVLSRLERMKHYLSICNSGPSERLARIALRNRDKLLARNCALIDENLIKLDAFFARHSDLFGWKASDGSCTAFPRYKGPEGVEDFTRRLVDESSVLLLPGSIFASDLTETPRDRFRIGFGRSGLDEGLAALEAHLARNRV